MQWAKHIKTVMLEGPLEMSRYLLSMGLGKREYPSTALAVVLFIDFFSYLSILQEQRQEST